VNDYYEKKISTDTMLVQSGGWAIHIKISIDNLRMRVKEQSFGILGHIKEGIHTRNRDF
jgi:hypothetical protein